MTYCEAMRLGAMKRPQAFGKLIDYSTGGTCARGAVLDACGYTLDGKEMDDRIIFEIALGILESADKGSPFGAKIVQMNDMFRMSRTAIADRIESQGLDREIPEELLRHKDKHEQSKELHHNDTRQLVSV